MRHPNDLLQGEGRIMDVRKLIDFTKARLDFLSSQQDKRCLMDQNLFDPQNEINDLQSHQICQEHSSGLRSEGGMDPGEFEGLINENIDKIANDPSKKLLFDFLSND